MVNKQGMVTGIAIVAFVAVGAVVLIAYAMPLQNSLRATIPGLEREQRGDVFIGDQPGAEGPGDVGALVPEGGETGTAGEAATSGGNTTTAGQSGNTTASGDDALATDNPASQSDNPYSDLT